MEPIFWWVPIFSTLRNHQTSIPHVHRVSGLFQALQEFLQRFLQVRFHLKQLWPSENVVSMHVYIYIHTYMHTLHYITYIHTYTCCLLICVFILYIFYRSSTCMYIYNVKMTVCIYIYIYYGIKYIVYMYMHIIIYM